MNYNNAYIRSRSRPLAPLAPVVAPVSTGNNGSLVSLPSSLLPLPTNPTDQHMDYMTDSPVAAQATHPHMRKVGDRENETHESREPWWETYARLRVLQDRNRNKIHRVEDKTRSTARRQLDLEQRMDLLEAQLGIRTHRR
ncbi:Uncharacterized protein HZ326_11590 [Fusarium oxysporum f. sp. albedinis]|nr:Uncharacterized protein HZ326_11590 [Fusarium oxysporum f. sp. albedinis]